MLRLPTRMSQSSPKTYSGKGKQESVLTKIGLARIECRCVSDRGIIHLLLKDQQMIIRLLEIHRRQRQEALHRRILEIKVPNIAM